MYGLAAIAGSMLAENTGLPLNSQANLLMILRGMALPSLSLRWPDSITCGSSALISMTSPFLISEGTLSLGFSAMIVSRFLLRSAAPAADGDLPQLLICKELALAGFCDRNDVLRGGEPDTG